MLNREIARLVSYGIVTGLIPEEERIYSRNLLLDLYHEDSYEEPEAEGVTADDLEDILKELLDEAVRRGLLPEDSVTYRDLWDTRLMNCLVPRPKEVIRTFLEYEKESPKKATDYFYKLSQDSDYIRRYRVKKDLRWKVDSPYGPLDISINLSKPEKDPRDIAAQRSARQTGYPKCMLCVENPGYAGRIGFPARQNHRMIPLTLNHGPWYLQYSPYLYYSEHCIVLNAKHTPMRICRETFERLCDFVTQFPHYMLGSNADLPIVGGSILSHDHFQGGNYRFPMDDAPVRIALNAPDAAVKAHVADWPMSCIVLESADRAAIVEQSDRILNAWRAYSDPSCDILAETDGTPHNTVTPILRMQDGKFRMELVLRNNRTSAEHPLGIFHPHADLHHIKKENIGLIEVMGLFILPGRLLSELSALEDYLTGKHPMSDRPDVDSPLHKHFEWLQSIAAQTGTNLAPEEASAAIRKALGVKCARVLSDAGVYNNTPEGNAGVLRFLNTVGYTAK